MDPITLITLINTLTPGAARLITIIRRKDGTLDVLNILDEVDKDFDANLKQAIDWLANNPRVTP